MKQSELASYIDQKHICINLNIVLYPEIEERPRFVVWKSIRFKTERRSNAELLRSMYCNRTNWFNDDRREKIWYNLWSMNISDVLLIVRILIGNWLSAYKLMLIQSLNFKPLAECESHLEIIYLNKSEKNTYLRKIGRQQNKTRSEYNRESSDNHYELLI